MVYCPEFGLPRVTLYCVLRPPPPPWRNVSYTCRDPNSVQTGRQRNRKYKTCGRRRQLVLVCYTNCRSRLDRKSSGARLRDVVCPQNLCSKLFGSDPRRAVCDGDNNRRFYDVGVKTFWRNRWRPTSSINFARRSDRRGKKKRPHSHVPGSRAEMALVSEWNKQFFSFTILFFPLFSINLPSARCLAVQSPTFCV